MLVVSALSGCGLISSDVTNFNLDLPDKTFSVDTARWNVSQQAADAYLKTTCDPQQPPPNVCNSAASNACAMGCTGSCAPDNHCELTLQVSAHQSVDLLTEKPELKTINDEPIIKVTIDSVQYAVTANTLDIATPEMRIYVAPMAVMDPNDPMAKQVGSVGPVQPGETVSLRDITFTDGTDAVGDDQRGRQNLIDVMSNYKNPFNVLIGAKLVVQMGDTVPSGKLDALIHIKAHAGL
jgi:hypothetical protein